MDSEIERVDGEIRLWLGTGRRVVWPAEPGKPPAGTLCYLQHYDPDGGCWRSIPRYAEHCPAPEWPL